MLTIVTGQPRSGTSLTMMVLNGGGVTAEHNPNINDKLNKHGSFETNKKVAEVADGKSVKCLNPHQLFDVPLRDYKLVMPVRDPQQIILSRFAAFKVKNPPKNIDLQLENIEKHYRFIRFIANAREDMTLLEIPYDDYFAKTDTVVANIAEFLGLQTFDTVAAKAAVDVELFKTREMSDVVS